MEQKWLASLINWKSDRAVLSLATFKVYTCMNLGAFINTCGKYKDNEVRIHYPFVSTNMFVTLVRLDIIKDDL